MYLSAKHEFLTVARKEITYVKCSVEIKKLQRQIKYTTKVYDKYRLDLDAFRLDVVHRQLLKRHSLERQERFSKWLAKLNKVGYSRAVRFF